MVKRGFLICLLVSANFCTAVKIKEMSPLPTRCSERIKRLKMGESTKEQIVTLEEQKPAEQKPEEQNQKRIKLIDWDSKYSPQDRERLLLEQEEIIREQEKLEQEKLKQEKLEQELFKRLIIVGKREVLILLDDEDVSAVRLLRGLHSSSIKE